MYTDMNHTFPFLQKHLPKSLAFRTYQTRHGSTEVCRYGYKPCVEETTKMKSLSELRELMENNGRKSMWIEVRNGLALK